MDTYVSDLDFHAIYMDDVDMVFRYPWMEQIGMININEKNNFMKLSHEEIESHYKIFLLLNRKIPKWIMNMSL